MPTNSTAEIDPKSVSKSPPLLIILFVAACSPPLIILCVAMCCFKRKEKRKRKTKIHSVESLSFRQADFQPMRSPPKIYGDMSHLQFLHLVSAKQILPTTEGQITDLRGEKTMSVTM